MMSLSRAELEVFHAVLVRSERNLRRAVERLNRFQQKSKTMKPQLWFCDRCLVIGVVMHEEHEDVMSVSNRIREAHLKYRPSCRYSERLIVPENLKTDHILCTGR